jgi:hypothetical protein
MGKQLGAYPYAMLRFDLLLREAVRIYLVLGAAISLRFSGRAGLGAFDTGPRKSARAPG